MFSKPCSYLQFEKKENNAAPVLVDKFLFYMYSTGYIHKVQVNSYMCALSCTQNHKKLFAKKKKEKKLKNLLPLYYKMCLIDHDSLNSVFKRRPQQSLHRIVLCKYFDVSINEFNVIINCGNNALISGRKNVLRKLLVGTWCKHHIVVPCQLICGITLLIKN